MADALDVLRKPVITEKSSRLRENNCFVLDVAPEATKGQVRMAVEARFKVQVVAVRTIRLPGKFRRRGAIGGYQSDRKKAIVRLKEGQQIKWDEAT